MIVTREQLYEDVWSAPATSLKAKYKVSSTYLARICGRLNVPRPPRGYWAKLKFGQTPPRPPLPPPLPGDELDWAPGLDDRYWGHARTPPAPPRAPTGDPVVRRVKRSALHPVLHGARDHFLGGRELGRFFSGVPFLRPRKQKLADIVVTKDLLEMALREANAIFQALEARGHRVMLAPWSSAVRYSRAAYEHREHRSREYHERSWSPATPTLVFVGTVAFGLTLFESTEEVLVRVENGEYVRVAPKPEPATPGRRPAPVPSNAYLKELASGRLAVMAYSPYPRVNWRKVWRASRRGNRPALPEEIAAEVEAAAPLIAERFAEAERQRLEEIAREEAAERERRRRELERQRQQATEASRRQLLRSIEAWGLIRSIESFFVEAEGRIGGLPESERQTLVDRLQEARTLMGSLDPLEHFRDWLTPTERLTASRTGDEEALAP